MRPESDTDRKYWTWNIFYYNKEDKRTIVPGKAPLLGPTLNLARASTWLYLCGVSIAIMVLFFILDLIQGRP